MGKSSLAVRTITRLNAAGVRTAFVDLTRLGATGADPERWYAGFLAETGRALGLRAEAMAYLKANAALPAVARLFGFLREEALARIDGPVVLLIDEVDAVRSLPFPADDLFAGLRELWNARVTDPALSRLAVCLLGAALPSDLIADPRRTPFNVGRRVDLRDLTPEEAAPFASQVGDEALDRVLRWTGGHPFLTQALCSELSGTLPLWGRQGGSIEDRVDALVRSRYLDARARDSDTNLADVGNRLLGTGDPNVADEDRATTLALYGRMLRGRDMPDDEANPATARIKMSGVARVEGGQLRVRNRIYAEAFDARWVRDNTPGQELRRQRRAFYRGVLRTGATAMVVIAAVGGLAWNNARLARIADDQRRTALKAYYAATMQNLEGKQEANDITAIGRTLDALKDNASRGWEWDHWNVVARPALRTIVAGGRDRCKPALLADGRTAVLAKGDGVEVFDLRSGRNAGRIALPWSGRGYLSPVPLHSGELLVFDGTATLARVDVGRRRVVQTRTLPFHTSLNTYQTGPVGRAFPITEWHLDGSWSMVLLDTATLKTRTYPADRPGLGVDAVSFGPDGSRVAFLESATDRAERWTERVSIRASGDWREIRAFDLGSKYCTGFGWSPDGRWLSFARENGEVYLADLRAAAGPRLVGKLPKSAYNTLPSADGRTVLACGDPAARELDARTGRVVQSYPETSFVWSIDGGRDLLTCYWDFRIYRAGRVERGVRARTLPRNIYPAGYSHRVDPDGRVSAFPTDDSGMWTLDLNRSGAATHTNHLQGRDRRDLIAVRYGAGKGALVDNATGRKLPFRIDLSGLANVAATRDRRTVVVGHDARSFAVYDSTSANPKAIIPVEGEPRDAAFSADDRRLALGDSRGGVTIVDAATRRPLARVPVAGVPVINLGFSEDGRSLYAVDDQQVAVVDVATGRLRTRLVGNSDAVFCVAFHPDGTRVATGSADGTVRIWDANDGREMTVLGRHPSNVVAVGFIDGGRSLASLDDAGGIRVWLSQREGP